MSIDISELSKLPLAEKLKLVESLWGDITTHNTAAVSQAAIDEPVRRSAELSSDPSLAIDEAELWRRVDG